MTLCPRSGVRTVRLRRVGCGRHYFGLSAARPGPRRSRRGPGRAAERGGSGVSAPIDRA